MAKRSEKGNIFGRILRRIVDSGFSNFRAEIHRDVLDACEVANSGLLGRLEKVNEELAASRLGLEELARRQDLLGERQLAILKSIHDNSLGHRERLLSLRASRDYDGIWAEKDPLVSVRIATYDRTEPLVNRSIPSVLNQTYKNWELIIVGDGSPAGVQTAVDGFGDARIKYFNRPFRYPYPEDIYHRWLVAGIPGMNEGAARASGSWIAPLDDDDEFTPDHIETLLRFALANKYEMAYGRLERRFSNGETDSIFSSPPQHGGFSFQGAIYSKAIDFFQYDIDAWTMNEPGDWNLCRRMLAAGVNIGAIDKVVGTLYSEVDEDRRRAESNSA